MFIKEIFSKTKEEIIKDSFKECVGSAVRAMYNLPHPNPAIIKVHAAEITTKKKKEKGIMITLESLPFMPDTHAGYNRVTKKCWYENPEMEVQLTDEEAAEVEEFLKVAKEIAAAKVEDEDC